MYRIVSLVADIIVAAITTAIKLAGMIAFILLVIVCVAGTRGAYSGGKDIVKDLASSPRSKSEAAVVRELEKITGEEFPTVYPDWLIWKGRRLELDGYSAKLKLALEFSGPLHTKWYSDKESYRKYFQRVMNDQIKLNLCAANGVYLIVVDMSLPFRHVHDYLVSRIYDATGGDKPYAYIPAQTAEPFRNATLEREEGLDAIATEVKKLKLSQG